MLFDNEAAHDRLKDFVYQRLAYYLEIDPTPKSAFAVKLARAPLPVGLQKSLKPEALKYFSEAFDISRMSDGVRAFIGMIAVGLALPWTAIYVDEPEAFLHPPLARFVGRSLAEFAREKNGHLFVATHSADFLVGCLESGIPINVVRLTYRNDVPTARLLDSAQLTEMMRDPLIRSVGLLSGLFYESVIVSESDADRAYYGEINQRLLGARVGGSRDTAFLSGYGKSTLPRMFGALRQAGVPAAVIVDLDIVKKGDGWNAWMKAASISPGLRPSLGQMRSAVFEAFKAVDREPKEGYDKLDSDGRRVAETFCRNMAEYGIFVVPVGELEQWETGLARGKPEWIAAVFEMMKSDPRDESYLKPPKDFSEPRASQIPSIWQFLDSIRTWLSNPDRRGMPGTGSDS